MTSVGIRLPLALCAVMAGLGLIIVLEATHWGGQSADGTPMRPIGATSGAQAPSLPPPDQHTAWLNEILARPLFSPDRRPVEVGVQGLPRLTGVIVNGTERVAIFASSSADHPLVARAGSHVGKYEVRSIAEAGVTVVGPEGTTLIKPTFDTTRPAAATPFKALEQRPRVAPRP